MIELIIRNAQLRKRKGQLDIAISAGKINKIQARIKARGKKEIDAKGMLVTESFVNPHLHLCKVYTLEMMTEEALKAYHGEGMGKAMSAIELAAKVKEKYNEKWIIPNVRRAVRLAALNGVTHIRAFADVDSKAKLIGLKALLKVREEFKGIVTLQVVAFPQDGVAREPGTVELIRESMELGADVVGGIPWIEFTDRDAQDHVDQMVAMAKEYDKDISMLVDDAGDPGLRTIEMLALAVIREDMVGRALAHHARAMALYPGPYFQKLSALLKKARMGVVSDPHTGPLHARVKELLAEGNLVSLGQDDISDAYYPYGRNNMLEVAFLNSHLLWMTTLDQMETLYDMVTTNGAKCMNVKDFGIKVGKTANIVVLGEKNLNEALRTHREPLYVISHGKLIDPKKLKV
jgi:cytosine deaminase